MQYETDKAEVFRKHYIRKQVDSRRFHIGCRNRQAQTKDIKDN